MEQDIKCNCCGKQIGGQAGLATEEYLQIKKEWGYFSRKDGTLQEMNICEACFDNWISHFLIPVKSTEVTELV